MPDRIIRDEALNSDRLLGLKRNTHRLAFVACVLEADDLGNLEAGPGALWRLWRDWLALTDRTQVAEIVLALSDADLIRLYEVDGKRYAHIPKFRQRLRYVNGKHPRPPSPLECSEINGVLQKRPTEGGPQSYHGRTTDGRREVKRSEEKRSNTLGRSAPVSLPEGFKAFWTAYPNLGRRKNRATCLSLWKSQGLEVEAAAIVAHVEGMKRTPGWCPDSAGDHFEPEAERYLRKRNWEDGLPDNVSRRGKVAL